MVTIRMYGKLESGLVDQFERALQSGEDVIVGIDSPGGDTKILAEILMYVDELKKNQHNIRGFVLGEASSAAFTFLQHCCERWAVREAKLLFHPPVRTSGVRWDDLSQRRTVLTEDVHYIALLKLMAERAGVPVEQFRQWGLEDRILTATQALELKLLDRIEPEKERRASWIDRWLASFQNA